MCAGNSTWQNSCIPSESPLPGFALAKPLPRLVFPHCCLDHSYGTGFFSKRQIDVQRVRACQDQFHLHQHMEAVRGTRANNPADYHCNVH